MQHGKIQQLMEILYEAFGGLGTSVSPIQVESLATTIHKAMAGEARYFHTPEHVLRLAQSSTPIQKLAALFHDIVYHQVDRGLIPEVEQQIGGYLVEKEDGLYLSEKIDPGEGIIHLTVAVFGFQTGQKLLYNTGLNEFLSALVMAKELVHLLIPREIVKVAVCIESTIPFRGVDSEGHDSYLRMEKRLGWIEQHYRLGLTTEVIQDTLKEAVLFANKDVESFGEQDPAVFLVDTWKLIPETNVALRSGGIYTIKDYRLALQKTDMFFNFLDPGTIFHAYHGVPPEDQYRSMVKRARSNLNTAREYLGVKLFAIGLLEAFAEVTGGDSPLSSFMGGLEKSEQTKRLEDYLPPIAMTDSVIILTQVFRLLEVGRAEQTNFDMSYSPLSGYLYKSLGTYRIRYYLELARAMFEGKIKAVEFLNKLDPQIVTIIAKACAEMVPSRRELFLKYADKRVV